jgi:hypothetical protein
MGEGTQVHGSNGIREIRKERKEGKKGGWKEREGKKRPGTVKGTS